MIMKDDGKFSFISQFYRTLVILTKILAIYFALSMGWNFSIILFIVLILLFIFSNNLSKSADIYKKNIKFTPLNKLKKGAIKVQGRVMAKEMLSAPLDGRLCVGYRHEIYDTDDNEEQISIKDEIICNDFILSDGVYQVNVNSKNIFLYHDIDEIEQNINNKIHVQSTLCQNDEIILIGNASLDINNNYELNYSSKGHEFIAIKKDDIQLLDELRERPTQILMIGFFFSCIVACLILMMNISNQSSDKLVFSFDLNQILTGNFIHFFNDSFSFYFNSSKFFTIIFESNSRLLSILTIIGSFLIYYILSKLSKFLIMKNFSRLYYMSIIVSLPFLFSGIFSLLSAIVLFIFSSDFIALKSIIIWCAVFIINIINYIISRFIRLFE